MRREDLRVWYCLYGVSACIARNTTTEPEKHRACGHRTLTPAEFDRLAREWAVERGWVEPPDCGDCARGLIRTEIDDSVVCLSCGGGRRH